MKKFLCNVVMIVCIFSGMNVDGQNCSDCFVTGCTYGAFATDSCSFAQGDSSLASGIRSVAVGVLSKATGGGSICIGSNALASGGSAHVFGPNSMATAPFATAIGSGAVGSGNVSMAIGEGVVASGHLATGIGSTSTSAGDMSFVQGYYSNALADGSFAIGELVTSDAENAYVIGRGLWSSPLVNSDPNTMMFGMNSDVPTLFLDNSGGTSGTWGNVGIGNITAPASLLHVRNQVRVGLDNEEDGSLVFNNSAGDIITFNTPTSMSTQSYTLPTAVGVNGDVLTYTTGGQLTWGSGGTATNDWRLDGNNNATASSKLGTLNNQPLMVYANNAERMRVTTAGNVGIGTPSPTARLHVRAAPTGHEQFLHLTVNDAALPENENYLRILNYTGTADELGFMVEARNGNSATVPALTLNGVLDQSVDAGSTAPVMTFNVRKVNTSGSIANRPLFSWHNDGSARMRMDAAGNLGIGTTTPSGRLHVNGTVFANLSPVGAAGNYTRLVGGELVEYTSTINHKTEIQDIEFDKQAFLSLRPVDFKWKQAYGGVADVGLIAEEVGEKMPNMLIQSYKRTYIDDVTGEVLRDSLGNPVLDSTQQQPWGVDYHKALIYLLAIVKEQDALIENLLPRVENLEQTAFDCCQTPSARLGQEDTGDAITLPPTAPYLKVYPNPSDGNLTVEYGLGQYDTGVLTMVSSNGQRTFLETLQIKTGKSEYSLSVPSGVCTISLENSSGAQLVAKKLVVIR